ncbi:MAG: serine/threonine-protein kinase [Blautia sp.]|nr:serine/threonine-protein kinase [Blautia sp.]MDY5030420.1 serine/threonine-protein kinase [Blautia sp.]
MDVNKLCFGCMKEKENPGQRCPRCGFDINEYMQNCSARVLRPGTILNGQYLVGKVLGEGGFGITYLAFDLNVMMAVAIKEYFPSGLASRDGSEKSDGRISAFSGEKKNYFEHGLNNFVEEVRKLMQFRDYEGIVKVNTLFYENGTAYMVMEYIRGKSLKQYLQEKQVPLSEAETLAIMKPVLRILGKVHESGVIHRDVSPDNIMLGDNGKVYLIDFGAARMVTGAETKSLEVMLKPGYTPFEQYYSKGNMGPWTDVYAVCATMYRMLSGKIPQESAARMSVDQVKTLKELTVEKAIPPLSTQLSDVIEKGMSLKEEDRYSDMETLLNELKNNKKKQKEKSEAITRRRTGGKKWLFTGSVAVIVGILVLFSGIIIRENLIQNGTVGEKLYQAGKFEQAKKYLEKSAVKENAQAQFRMGLMYMNGNGVAPDCEKAVEYFEEAASQKHAGALNCLAECYDKGRGVQQDIEKANSLYGEALRQYEKLAGDGDSDAQYALGNACFYGNGTACNYDQAEVWYEKAAEQGNADAKFMLGQLYSTFSWKWDLDRSWEWYQSAFMQYIKEAEQGNDSAQYSLANAYYWGYGVVVDYGNAAKWYEKAAEQGNVKAQDMLGHMYLEGNGVEPSIEKAREWYRKTFEQYKKCADSNDPDAQYILAEYYSAGNGVEQDYQKAARWYEKAAEQGNVNAQRALGSAFWEGKGMEINEESTLKWYGKALAQYEQRAALGNADIQYRLGDCYYLGDGVEMNFTKAQIWYEKAAEQGNVYAQKKLGDMYYEGLYLEEDKEKALKWYFEAAGQGYYSAQEKLGDIYVSGNGVKKDLERAQEWYTKALDYHIWKAEHGDMYEQYLLGSIYGSGKSGVIKDCEEKFQWYKKAAEQGYCAAQESLGFMYAEGDGVEQDPEKALEWYGKAMAYMERKAEYGDADLQCELGKIYFNGNDFVTQNRQKGLQWYEKAAEQGNLYSREQLGNMYANGQEGTEMYRKWYDEVVQYYRVGSNFGIVSTDSGWNLFSSR